MQPSYDFRDSDGGKWSMGTKIGNKKFSESTLFIVKTVNWWNPTEASCGTHENHHSWLFLLSWWFSVGDILGLIFSLCNAFYCCWHKRHVEYATGDDIGFYHRGRRWGRSEIDSAWYRSRYPWDYWFVLIFNNSRPNKEI